MNLLKKSTTCVAAKPLDYIIFKEAFLFLLWILLLIKTYYLPIRLYKMKMFPSDPDAQIEGDKDKGKSGR